MELCSNIYEIIMEAMFIRILKGKYKKYLQKRAKVSGFFKLIGDLVK